MSQAQPAAKSRTSCRATLRVRGWSGSPKFPNWAVQSALRDEPRALPRPGARPANASAKGRAALHDELLGRGRLVPSRPKPGPAPVSLPRCCLPSAGRGGAVGPGLGAKLASTISDGADAAAWSDAEALALKTET